jgi:uncharacterized membrane protein
MAASSLSYIQYRDYQILGVTLSRQHAVHPEVKKIVNTFKKACYLVLLFSTVCSFLLLIPFIRPYADFTMFFMMALNLFANWFVINLCQKSLMNIKEQNKWIYPKKSIATVDLNVSRAKGKSAISPVWVWLFFILSFIPMVFLLINSDMRIFYPLIFSFIGPFCQVSLVFLYYQMVNQPSRILDDKTVTNLLFAQQHERINSITATLSSLSMLLFWILFSFSMLYMENSIMVIAPVVFLITAVLIIEHWHQKKMRKLEENITGSLSDGEEDVQERESTWKCGCYYNPDDHRIFVPKRAGSMGWTINIGRPVGKALYLGTIVLVLVVIIFAVYGGIKDYEIEIDDQEIIVDAAMYDISFKKEDIDSISLTEQLPNGIRTNGYGGANKSFGHFMLDEYGNCMLYIYSNVNQYIVVQLKGNDPGYVILNCKTEGETEELYKIFNSWISE